ncbi:MAG: hypothetical protein FWC04_06215 [Chitinispirillia bacterium]|nr:hypothetical protein [Chitinispirillia bacterium]
MKKLSLCVLALAVCAPAAEKSLDERVDGLQAQIERVAAKAGIQISGEFRSQFLNSQVSGSAVEDDAKAGESAEYTSVDFDIVARPNTALSARAVFRLHQDWRIFFSDLQNPIVSRWLSVDGSLMDGIFKYNVGDYRKKLSPLTLWSPDLELLYEPEIFAQSRRLAMSELFLGENDRLLQGANLSFKAELYPILSDVTFDAFGSRLVTRGAGETAATPAPGVVWDSKAGSWAANYDKYLTGLNLSVDPVEGAHAGLSYISIFDDENTYIGNVAGGQSHAYDPELSYEENAKLNSQMTGIVAGRLNVDNRTFMPVDFAKVGVNAEFAFSSDKDNYRNADNAVADSAITGLAMNVGLAMTFNLDDVSNISLTGSYIMNDAGFRNEAAQSPTFLQRAIMNNENALGGLGVMNPFDAMYRTVFKYAPSQYFGAVKPYTKNAYTNVILSGDQVAKLSGASDAYHGHRAYAYPNVFQSALPGGLATANRSGAVAGLKGSFLDKGVTVGGKIAMVASDDENAVPYYDDDGAVAGINVTEYVTDYMEAVGGFSVNIAKFAPAVGPSLVIGGSYGMYNVTNDYGANKSTLGSAELNYNFYKNFSLLAGYQYLETLIEDAGVEVGNYNFENVAFGLNCKVADGGSLTFKWTIVTAWNYLGDVGYTAHQPELFLTVKF